MSLESEPSDTEVSITAWLARLRAGDSPAGNAIWQRYLKRLVGLARRKLADSPRRMADEEDLVQSAFNGFFRGVDQQRFLRLEDREDLWQVLVMLTERKTIGRKRHDRAVRRGQGQVRRESALVPRGVDEGRSPEIQQLAARQPSSEFVVEFSDHLGYLLARLEGDQLREVALTKLEGYSNREIATQLDLSLRGVERKLHLIRRKWEELEP